MNSKSWRIAAALVITAFIDAAAAQPFPDRPVRIIAPYSAGSGPDAVIRHIGDKLARAWGQPIIVDNRPGANGWIAIEAAKKSPPDGHTLVLMDNSHVALQPHLYKQLPFDPAKDFEPVAALFRAPFFIVVPASSNWTSVADLIAAAKAKGGELTYGSWGVGSVGHVGTAMFEAATGTRMTHVPYKELSQLYIAVGNGEVTWAFGTAGTAGPMVRAHKVRFLAIAAHKRLAAFPDVPTVSESGGPADFDVKGWVALFAPRATPKAVVERISAAVATALLESDVRDRLSTFGFETSSATPQDVAKAIVVDAREFAKVVKRVKISLD